MQKTTKLQKNILKTKPKVFAINFFDLASIQMQFEAWCRFVKWSGSWDNPDKTIGEV